MPIENAYIAKIVEGIQQALPPQNEYDKGYSDALQSFVISLSQAKGSFLNLQLIEDSVKTALDAHLNNAPEVDAELDAEAKGDEGTGHLHEHEGNTCKQCGSHLGRDGYCNDQTCVYSDWHQVVTRKDISLFSTEEIEVIYSVKKKPFPEANS